MKKKKLKDKKISEEILKDVEITRDFFRLYENDEAKKIQCVTQLQNLAFDILRGVITEYLRPVSAKEPRSFSDNTPLKKLEEMYTVEKIRMEWNPSAVEVFQFCNKAGNAGLYGSQHNAAWMLYFCTAAIEKNAVPDYVQDSILEAFAGLDDDVVAGWEKHGMRTQEGRNKGGDTIAKRSRAHQSYIKDFVESILKNPATAHWKDGQIIDELMKHENKYHEFEGVSIGKRQMRNHVIAIRDKYIARYSTG